MFYVSHYNEFPKLFYLQARTGERKKDEVLKGQLNVLCFSLQWVSKVLFTYKDWTIAFLTYASKGPYCTVSTHEYRQIRYMTYWRGMPKACKDTIRQPNILVSRLINYLNLRYTITWRFQTPKDTWFETLYNEIGCHGRGFMSCSLASWLVAHRAFRLYIVEVLIAF